VIREKSAGAPGLEEEAVTERSGWGLAVGISRAWSLSERTSLLSVAMLLLLLLLLSVLMVARGRPDLFPFLDRRVLGVYIHVSLLVSGVWFLLLLAAVWARRHRPDAIWRAHLPIQFFALDNAFNAYMLGVFTNPFGILSVAGGLPVALLTYGVRPTRLGVISFVAVLGATTLGSQFGLIPYAPLMTASPVTEGHLAPAWAAGFGLLMVVGCAVFMFVSHRIAREIGERETALRSKHAELFVVHEDLVQVRWDLELSRDALEERVKVRTRELSEANERLHDEIACRAKLSDDLEALRLVMEDAVEGIAWLGGDGRIEGVNGAYAKMHGCQPGAMLGTHWQEWTHPDDHEIAARGTAQLASHSRHELDFRGVRVDGSGFRASAVLVADVRRGDGSHFRFLRDVTRNRELSEQLTQAAKMDAIGRLAGGVAHDFNNLLAAIVAAAEQLGDRPEMREGSAESEELLAWIQASAQRGACLTRQLLDFSRPQSEEREVVDVTDSVRGVVAILGPALGTHIRVRTDFGCERLPVCTSESRLQASVMGLALNARDAMADGGEILFSTGLEMIVEPDVRFAGFPMRPGRYARIEVKDRGAGIPEAMLGKVFEPFFTTKPPGEGSGLGLPLLYNFVSEMGGGVHIESSAEQGTQVCILFPLAPSELAVSQPLDLREGEGPGGTILVAEDEDVVRQVVVKMLQGSGFVVIGCADGEEALREYETHRMDVDLVLLDVRIPVRDGIDTLRSLRRAGSRVPAILMSGNLSRAEVEGLPDREFLERFSILNKPFGRPDLTKAIEEARAGI